MEAAQTYIAAWPALLSDQDAARYLSVDTAMFKIAAQEHKIMPVTVGSAERRWKKRDLDLLVGRLAYDEAYLAKSQNASRIKLDNQTVEAIALQIRKEVGDADGPQSRSHLVSISDALDLLGIGRSTVYRLLDNGTLTKKKVGRRTLITRTSIERLLDDQ